MSIEDRPLLWMVVKSQTFYPEHILAYGSRKTHYALVMGSGSFWTDWLEAGKGGGLSTILRPGLKCGAWSLSLDEDLDPSTGVKWVGLVYAWGYKRCVCFWVPSWDTLVYESPFPWDSTTWLWSSTVIRTERWWNGSNCSTLSWN